MSVWLGSSYSSGHQDGVSAWQCSMPKDPVVTVFQGGFRHSGPIGIIFTCHCHQPKASSSPVRNSWTHRSSAWAGILNPLGQAVTSLSDHPCHLICPGQWVRVISLRTAWAVHKCYPPPWVHDGLGDWALLLTCSLWHEDAGDSLLCQSAAPGSSLSMAAWPPMAPQLPMTVADRMTQPFDFIIKEESHGHQCLPVGVFCHQLGPLHKIPFSDPWSDRRWHRPSAGTSDWGSGLEAQADPCPGSPSSWVHFPTYDMEVLLDWVEDPLGGTLHCLHMTWVSALGALFSWYTSLYTPQNFLLRWTWGPWAQ